MKNNFVTSLYETVQKRKQLLIDKDIKFDESIAELVIAYILCGEKETQNAMNMAEIANTKYRQGGRESFSIEDKYKYNSMEQENIAINRICENIKNTLVKKIKSNIDLLTQIKNIAHDNMLIVRLIESELEKNNKPDYGEIGD